MLRKLSQAVMVGMGGMIIAYWGGPLERVVSGRSRQPHMEVAVAGRESASTQATKSS